MKPAWTNVWITGASSGIGRQLAIDLASSGCKVAVSARSHDALNALAATNPNIHSYPLDITNGEDVENVVASIAEDLGPIDLVIIAAGVWIIRDVSDFTAADSIKAMRVNYEGAVNVIAAVLPAMRARKKGHIAPIASVAGYRGIPRAVTYAPTKAALIAMAESLRTDAAQYGITVQVINPGFVKTPMTDTNDFPMPFIISPEEASRHIIDGLATNRFEVVFPWKLTLAMKVLRILPYRFYFWLSGKFMQR